MPDLAPLIESQPSRRYIMPFITAGDPDLNFTRELLLALDAYQPGLFEIGFPYSDPIADGPVIQASYTRALSNQIRVDQIFEMLASIDAQMTQPRVAMVSYAIVLRYGLDRFLEQAATAGCSGLIVPDYLWSTDLAFRDQCGEAGLHLIPLITPTTPRDRAGWLAEQATGFIYYVSVAGVTGERTSLPDDLVDNLTWLRQRANVPICVGFGVSGPQQVTQLKPHCDGMIVGSAIVKRMATIADGADPATVRQEICQFVSELIANA